MFGGLLGTTQGRDIEILNTFEVVVESDAHEVRQVDHAYFVTRKEQCKLHKRFAPTPRRASLVGKALTDFGWMNTVRQVFPTFDFLGWYSIGSAPTDEDIALHKQASTTSPVWLAPLPPLHLARSPSASPNQFPLT